MLPWYMPGCHRKKKQNYLVLWTRYRGLLGVPFAPPLPASLLLDTAVAPVSGVCARVTNPENPSGNNVGQRMSQRTVSRGKRRRPWVGGRPWNAYGGQQRE